MMRISTSYRKTERLVALLMAVLMMLSTFGTGFAEGLDGNQYTESDSSDFVQEPFEDILECDIDAGFDDGLVEEPDIIVEPADDIPIEDETAPIEGETTPAEGETTPIEGETTPIEGETTPASTVATLAELPEFTTGYAFVVPRQGLLTYAYSDAECTQLAGLFEYGAVVFALSSGAEQPALAAYVHLGETRVSFVKPENVVPMTDAQVAAYADANADNMLPLDEAFNTAFAGVALAEAAFNAPAVQPDETEISSDSAEDVLLEEDALAVPEDGSEDEIIINDGEGDPYTVRMGFEKNDDGTVKEYMSGVPIKFNIAVDFQHASQTLDNVWIYIKLPDREAAGFNNYSLGTLLEETLASGTPMTSLGLFDAAMLCKMDGTAKFPNASTESTAPAAGLYLGLNVLKAAAGKSVSAEINYTFANGITEPGDFTIDANGVYYVYNGASTNVSGVQPLSLFSTKITAQNEWNAPVKTSKQFSGADTEGAIIAKKDGTGYKFPAGSHIEYTLTSTPNNNNETGMMWTKYYDVTDTLTLPKAFMLPEGTLTVTDKTDPDRYEVTAGDGRLLLRLPKSALDAATPAVVYDSTSKTLTTTYRRVHEQLGTGFGVDSADPQDYTGLTKDMAGFTDTMTLYLDALVFDSSAAPTTEEKVLFKIDNTFGFTPVPLYAAGTSQSATAADKIPVPVDLKIDKASFKDYDTDSHTASDELLDSFVNIGDTFYYIITVKNPETNDAAQAVLYDNLPPYVEATGAAISVAKRQITDPASAWETPATAEYAGTVSTDIRFLIDPNYEWQIAIPVRVKSTVHAKAEFDNTAVLYYCSQVYHKTLSENELGLNLEDPDLTYEERIPPELRDYVKYAIDTVTNKVPAASIEKDTVDGVVEGQHYYGATEDTAAYYSDEYSCFTVTVTVAQSTLESVTDEVPLKITDKLPLGVFATQADNNKALLDMTGVSGTSIKDAGAKIGSESNIQTLTWNLPKWTSEYPHNGWTDIGSETWSMTYSIPVRFSEAVKDNPAVEDSSRIHKAINTAYLYMGVYSIELSAASDVYVYDAFANPIIDKKPVNGSTAQNINYESGSNFVRKFEVYLANSGTIDCTNSNSGLTELVLTDTLPVGIIFPDDLFTFTNNVCTFNSLAAFNTATKYAYSDEAGAEFGKASYAHLENWKLDQQTYSSVGDGEYKYTITRELLSKADYSTTDDKYSYVLTITNSGDSTTTFNAEKHTAFKLTLPLCFDADLLKVMRDNNLKKPTPQQYVDVKNIATYANLKATAGFLVEFFKSGDGKVSYDKFGFSDDECKSPLTIDDMVVLGDTIYFQLQTNVGANEIKTETSPIADRVDLLPEGLAVRSIQITSSTLGAATTLVWPDPDTGSATVYYPSESDYVIKAVKGTQGKCDTVTVSYNNTLAANTKYTVSLKVQVVKPLKPTFIGTQEGGVSHWYLINEWAGEVFPIYVTVPQILIAKDEDSPVLNEGRSVTFSVPSIQQLQSTGTQPLTNVYLVDDLSQFVNNAKATYDITAVTQGVYAGKVFTLDGDGGELKPTATLYQSVDGTSWTSTDITWDSDGKYVKPDDASLLTATSTKAILVWDFGTVTRDFAVTADGAPKVTITCTGTTDKETAGEFLIKRTNSAFLLYNNDNDAFSPVTKSDVEAESNGYTSSNVDSEDVWTSNSASVMSLTKTHTTYAGNPLLFNNIVKRSDINGLTNLAYTLEFKNVGNTGDTTGVTINDVLPSHLMWSEGTILDVSFTRSGSGTNDSFIRKISGVDMAHDSATNTYTYEGPEFDLTIVNPQSGSGSINVVFNGDYATFKPSDRATIIYYAHFADADAISGDPGFYTQNIANSTVENVATLTHDTDKTITAKDNFKIEPSPLIKLSKTAYSVYNSTDDGTTYTKADKSATAAGSVIRFRTLLYAGGTEDVNVRQLVDELPVGMTFMGVSATETVAGNDGEITFGENRNSAVTKQADVKTRNSVGKDSKDFAQNGTVLQSVAGVSYSAADDSGKVTLTVSGDALNGGYTLKAGSVLVFDVYAKIDKTSDSNKSYLNKIYLEYDRDETANYMNIPMLLDSRYGFTKLDTETISPDENTASLNDSLERFTATAKAEIGQIHPDIRKDAIGYVYNNRKHDLNPDSEINLGSDLIWKITVKNVKSDFNNIAMSNYSVTDQLPYAYSGTEAYGSSVTDVSVKKYCADGKTVTDLTPPDTLSAYNLVSGSAEDGSAVYQEVVTWQMAGSDYTLQPGDHIEITLTSKYSSTSLPYSLYSNTALLTPSPLQTFDERLLPKDTLANVVTYNGLPSLSTSVYVAVLGSFASSSWKEITAKDPDGLSATANSFTGNHVVEGTPGGAVKYQLNVKNDSSKTFDKLYIVDRMPQVNDHGIVNSAVERGSEFTVSLAKADMNGIIVDGNPSDSFSVTIGASKKYALINGTHYVVEYAKRDPNAAFASADWNADWAVVKANWLIVHGGGTVDDVNGWNCEYAAGDNVFRVVFDPTIKLYGADDENNNPITTTSPSVSLAGDLGDMARVAVSHDPINIDEIVESDAAYTPSGKGAVLSIDFYGKIDADAYTGQIAWNNFAYKYSCSGVSLNPEPPRVGVYIRKPGLTIRKVVTGVDSASEKEFTLKLQVFNPDPTVNDFADFTGELTKYSAAGEAYPDKIETGIFTLKNGEYVTMTDPDIPINRKYRVLEQGSGTDNWVEVTADKQDITIGTASYVVSGSNASGLLTDEGATCTVTNSSSLSLKLAKTWIDSGKAARPEWVTFTVAKKISEDNYETLKFVTTGTDAIRTVKVADLTTDNVMTVIIDDLPVLDSFDKYYVFEDMPKSANGDDYYVCEFYTDANTGTPQSGSTVNVSMTNTQKTSLIVRKAVPSFRSYNNTAFKFEVSIGASADSLSPYIGSYTLVPGDGSTLNTSDGTIELAKDQSFVINDIPVNNYFKVTEVISADFEQQYNTSFGTSNSNVWSGQLTDTKKDIVAKAVTCTNSRLMPLQITKALADTTTDTTTEFSFKVKIGGVDYTGSYSVGSANYAGDNTNATVIKLKADETAELDTLYPVGTSYTVYEVLTGAFDEKYYAAQYKVGSADPVNFANYLTEPSVNGRIVDSTGGDEYKDYNLVTFINAHSATFKLKKTVESEGASASDSFTFRVYVNNTLYGANHTYNTYTVGTEVRTTDNGVVVLKKDELATFKARPGAAIKVVEIFDDTTRNYFYPEITATGLTAPTTTNTTSSATITGAMDTGTTDVPLITFNNIKHDSTRGKKAITLLKTGNEVTGDADKSAFAFTITRVQKDSAGGTVYSGPYVGNVSVLANGSETPTTKYVTNGKLTLKYGDSAVIPVMTNDVITITETVSGAVYRTTVKEGTEDKGEVIEWSKVIADTDTDTKVTFSNDRLVDLKIVKTDSVRSVRVADTDQSFEFKAYFGVSADSLTLYTGQYYIGDKSFDIDDATGIITLKLGQTAVIKGLSALEKYKIVETSDADYKTDPETYTYEGTLDSETATNKGRVTISRTFKNDRLVRMRLTKSVDFTNPKNDELKNEAFTFLLKFGGIPYSGYYKIIANRSANRTGTETVFETTDGKLVLYASETVELVNNDADNTPVYYKVGDKFTVSEILDEHNFKTSVAIKVDGAATNSSGYTIGYGTTFGVCTITGENSLDNHLLTVRKTIAEGTDVDTPFMFQLYVDGSLNTSGYYLIDTDGTTRTYMDSSSGYDNGSISLKAGQSAEFAIKHGNTYTIIEKHDHSYDYPRITVDNTTAENNIKLYWDGAVNPYAASGTMHTDTTFTYENVPNSTAYVTLEKALFADGAHANDKFTFNVTRSFKTTDGIEHMLPYDGEYMLYDKDSTVTGPNHSDGTIVLKDGQKAVLNARPGDKFTFEEVSCNGGDAADLKAAFITEVNNVVVTSIPDGEGPSATISTGESALFSNIQRTQLRLTKYADPEPAALPGPEFTFTVNITDKDGDAFPITSYDLLESGAEIESDLPLDNGTLKLKHNQTALISNIPYGSTYTIVESKAPEYALAGVSVNDLAMDPLDYKVTGEMQSVVSVNYVNSPLENYPKITVSKTVASGSSTERFTFTLTQRSIATGLYEPYYGVIDVNGRKVSVTDGTFTLSDSETATISMNSALYDKYIVTESVSSVYSTEVSVNGGAFVSGNETGALDVPTSSDVTPNSTFKNTLIPAPVNQILRIAKVNNGGAAADRFTFRVYLAYNGGTFGGAYSGFYYLDDEIVPRIATDGIITLAGGQHAEIRGLTSDMTFRVEEEAFGDYKAFVTYNGQTTSGNTVEGSMIDFTTNVTFTNTLDIPCRLALKKLVAGTVTGPQSEFAFTINIDGVPYSGEYKLNGVTQLAPMQDGHASLRADDVLEINDLRVGQTYSITEQSYDGYISEVTSGAASGPIIAETNVTFTNTYEAKPGMLTLTKLVKDALPGSTDTFAFTVRIDGALYTGKYKLNGAEQSTPMANGAVSLGANDVLTIEGLKVGQSYSVTEQNHEGYTSKVTSGSASGNISADTAVTFTNIYGIKPGKLTLTKLVKDALPSSTDTFAFTILIDGVLYTGKYKLNGAEQSTPMANGAVSLGADDVLTIEGLKVGQTYSVTEQNHEDYTSKVTSGSASGNIAADTKVEYTNTRVPEEKGQLTITKTTTGENADLTKAFDFTLLLNGTPYNGPYTLDSVSLTMADGKFSLAHGQTAVISDITLDTTYTVTEADYSAQGYVVSSTNPQTGKITEASKVAVASFVNVYTPPVTKGQLSISKVTTGENADLTKAFDFTLLLNGTPYNGPYTLDSASLTMADGKFSLAHGQTAVISDIALDATYTVTEADYSAEGYTTNTPTMFGTISKQSPNVALHVKNVFEPTPSTDGRLTVSKTQVGGPADTRFSFTIRVDGKLYSGEYALVHANGSAETLTATAGIVSLMDGERAEISGLPLGKSYSVSETSYEGFTATPAAVQSGILSENSSVAFVNTYDRPVTGGLSISKRVVNSTTNQQFSFTLTLDGVPYSGAYTVTNANGVSSIASTSDGTILLRGGETAAITGIKAGTAYNVVESPVANFTANVTEASGTITETVSAETFVNTYIERNGDIIIAKHQAGGAVGVKFTFGVQLGNFMYEGPYTVYAADGSATNYAAMPNGVLRLAGNETAVIKGIPEGTFYRVREQAFAGFTQSNPDQRGNVPSTSVYLDFVNTYNDNSLVIEKRYEGGNTTRGFEFTVRIGGALYANRSYSLIDTDGSVQTLTTSAQGTLSLRGGQKAVISGLTAGSAYSVTETPGSDYTTQTYNAEGTIAQGTNNALFVNTDVSSAEAELFISKTQAGGPSGQVFTFNVTIASVPYTGEYTVRHADGSLSELETDNGVIRLKAGDTAHITGAFDGKTYRVTENAAPGFVTTADNATGTLVADSPSEAAFTNSMETMLEINKTQIGGEPGELFMFFVTLDGELYEGEYTYIMEDGSESQEIAYDGLIALFSGEKAIIGGLPYGAAYEVIEAYTIGYDTESTGDTGVTDGYSVAAFVNTYNPIQTPVALRVNKTVLNGLDTQSFTFTLSIDGKPYTGAYTHYSALGVPEEMNTLNGTFRLRNGEYVEMHGLRPGAAYEVVEEANSMYTTTGTNSIGTLSEDETIITEASFINTFNTIGPLPPTGDDLPLGALLALGMTLILAGVAFELAARRINRRGASAKQRG